MNPMQSPNTGVGGKDFGGKEDKRVCEDCAHLNFVNNYCQMGKKKLKACSYYYDLKWLEEDFED